MRKPVPLHDPWHEGQVRSWHAWQFARALGIAEKNGWTRFVSMQNLVNSLYREEEREMLLSVPPAGAGLFRR